MMKLEQAKQLTVGQKVRVLVDGSGHVFTRNAEVLRKFKAGAVVTVVEVQTFDNDQGFNVAIEAENGVYNQFDALDYAGEYPFEIVAPRLFSYSAEFRHNGRPTVKTGTIEAIDAAAAEAAVAATLPARATHVGIFVAVSGWNRKGR